MEGGEVVNLFLMSAAGLILFTVAVGLVRVLYGPTSADRMMAAQLLGTGGIAGMLLLANASENPAVVDVALVLAVVSGFVGIAFARGGKKPEEGR
jgi:multicomponent Na+:H+ antiporter subunit F